MIMAHLTTAHVARYALRDLSRLICVKGIAPETPGEYKIAKAELMIPKDDNIDLDEFASQYIHPLCCKMVTDIHNAEPFPTTICQLPVDGNCLDVVRYNYDGISLRASSNGELITLEVGYS